MVYYERGTPVRRSGSPPPASPVPTTAAAMGSNLTHRQVLGPYGRTYAATRPLRDDRPAVLISYPKPSTGRPSRPLLCPSVPPPRLGRGAPPRFIISSLQGYLAHTTAPPSLRPPYGPRHSPTTGSWEGVVSYERGTPVPYTCSSRKRRTTARSRKLPSARTFAFGMRGSGV